MSQDIAKRNNTTVAPIVPQDMGQVHELANVICQADMAPKSYNRKPEAVMVAIMQGLEVGLTPMAAVQSIAVINGMPSLWGDGALGLVQGSGLLEDIEETVHQEGDKAILVATCRAKRKGRKTEIVRSFSLTDAQTAGLMGKDPWKKYPKRMLQMRARAWVLRDGFADVLKGLKIGEEARDIGDDEMTDITPAPERPKQENYKKSSSKKAEVPFELFDEYGVEIGQYVSADDFTKAYIDHLPEVSQDADDTLQAFKDGNADQVERLKPSSKNRKAMAQAYNDEAAKRDKASQEEKSAETEETKPEEAPKQEEESAEPEKNTNVVKLRVITDSGQKKEFNNISDWSDFLMMGIDFYGGSSNLGKLRILHDNNVDIFDELASDYPDEVKKIRAEIDEAIAKIEGAES